jgi:hypothetical protein
MFKKSLTKDMRSALIGIAIFIAVVFASFVLRHKTEVVVSPDTNTTTTNESIITLPSSFIMEVQGDFTDPTIISQYQTIPTSSATLLSSGGEELEGEAYYTYSRPGTDGNLISCGIKNKKWIVRYSDTDQVCQSLSRIATTRTELIKQITTGELKPIKSNECRDGELCYELK